MTNVINTKRTVTRHIFLASVFSLFATAAVADSFVTVPTGGGLKDAQVTRPPADGETYGIVMIEDAEGNDVVTWELIPDDPHPDFTGDLTYDPATNTVTYTDDDSALEAAIAAAQADIDTHVAADADTIADSVPTGDGSIVWGGTGDAPTGSVDWTQAPAAFTSPGVTTAGDGLAITGGTGPADPYVITHTPSDPHPTFTGDLVFDAATNTVSYTDIDGPVFSTRKTEDGCSTETLVDGVVVHTAVNRDELQVHRQFVNLGAITVTEAELNDPTQYPVGELIELDRETISWTNPSTCRAALVQVRVRQGNVGFGNLEVGNDISTLFTTASGGTPGPVMDTTGNTQVVDFRTGDQWQFADFSVPAGDTLTFDVAHAITLNVPFVEYLPGSSNYTTGARSMILLAWLR